MSDPLKIDDLIQDAINKVVSDQNSAIERYITEWFRACPDVNPADVALQVSHNGNKFEYQMAVVRNPPTY